MKPLFETVSEEFTAESKKKAKDFTYDEAVKLAKADKPVVKYIETNYNELTYGPKNIMGRYGHGLSESSIKKIAKLAKTDKELQKLLDTRKAIVDKAYSKLNESDSSYDDVMFMEFIAKELDWNNPRINKLSDKELKQELSDANLSSAKFGKGFYYDCLAGSSVAPELRAAIKKFDASLKPRVVRGIETSRRAERHDYYIFFK